MTRRYDDRPPVGEGAALIAATEQEIDSDLGGQDPPDIDTLVAQRDAWAETARILARALDASAEQLRRLREGVRALASDLHEDWQALANPGMQPGPMLRHYRSRALDLLDGADTPTSPPSATETAETGPAQAQDSTGTQQPSGPRWTDETERIVAGAWHRGTGCRKPDDCPNALIPTSSERAAASAVLTALADAGLLLPDGTQTRTEHGYRYRNSPDHDWTRIDIVSEDEAIAMVGDALATIPNAEAEHLTRRVHTEPWQPATREQP